MIDRVTVYEASQRLGISEGAVRQRIHRGTLNSERDESGKVYVFLTPDDTQDISVTTDQNNTVNNAIMDELRDRVRFLEAELDDRKEEARRKDSIIMSLTQRVPELEAASEPRESTVTASPEQSKGAVPQPEKSLSWWQRFFGP